jgi:predicted regulator of Ras-like GTPase activity (Roadblock/LC7/MglB family)
VLPSVGVDAKQALADLTEISSQVQAAVLLDAAGEPIAATTTDERRTQELARVCRELLAASEAVRSGGTARSPAQIEVAMAEGSVFVVRDGERTILATTGASPTVGLVFYDLKTCLRAVAAESDPSNGKPKRRRRTAKASAETGEAA